VSLTKDQTDSIQQKAITNFIRKTGYDMHFPRKVVYGSIKFGGLGFSQLNVESNCNKIQSIICHINNNTMLCKMMSTNLNWSQLLLGIVTPLLKNDNDISYIQKKWFTQLQCFLCEIDATISVQNCWVPSLQRENNCLIMEKVQRIDITNIHKKIFNNWQLFFQVDSLSDIMNINGTKFQEKFIQKKMVLNYTSTSVLNWPCQQMPSLHTFNIWTKTIKKLQKQIQIHLVR
jgi:hypothetical protein